MRTHSQADPPTRHPATGAALPRAAPRCPTLPHAAPRCSAARQPRRRSGKTSDPSHRRRQRNTGDRRMREADAERNGFLPAGTIRRWDERWVAGVVGGGGDDVVSTRGMRGRLVGRAGGRYRRLEATGLAAPKRRRPAALSRRRGRRLAAGVSSPAAAAPHSTWLAFHGRCAALHGRSRLCGPRAATLRPGCAIVSRVACVVIATSFAMDIATPPRCIDG